jgi:steroid 5-alpha reductase family enzyme
MFVTALFSALFTGLAVIVLAVTLVWLLSLVKRDVSIVDIFWGLGFVALSWFYRTLGSDGTSRHWLLLMLVTIWGFRLALYLLWRNWGHDEDPRYQSMRAYRGDNFWWMSLFTDRADRDSVVCRPAQRRCAAVDVDRCLGVAVLEHRLLLRDCR